MKTNIRYFGGKRFCDCNEDGENIKEEIRLLDEAQDSDGTALKQGDTVYCYSSSNCSQSVAVTLEEFVNGANEYSSGGEGTVFKAEKGGIPYAAKIYHERMRTRFREEKIKFMVENRVEDDSICWPCGLLRDSSGRFIGLLMELVKKPYRAMAEDEIRNFCQDKKRAVQILVNIAHAFEVLQNYNVVFGDFNFKNVFVNEDNLSVKIIDLDGAQVDRFPCLVASKVFNAPEVLDGAGYDSDGDPNGEEEVLALKNNYHKEYSTFLRDNYSLAAYCYYALFSKQPYMDFVEKSRYKFPFQVEGYQTQLNRESFFFRNYAPIWIHLPGFMKRAFCKCFISKDPNDRLNPRQWWYCLKYYQRLLESGELEKIDPECNKLVPEMLEDSFESDGGSGEKSILSKLNNIHLRRLEPDFYDIKSFSLESALIKASEMLERDGLAINYNDALAGIKCKGEYRQEDPNCFISLIYDVGVMKEIRLEYDVIIL